MFLITELNTFYLKFVLWWKPEHWLNGIRLFFMLLWGSVGLRETFQLLDDPDCDKLGRQSWVLAAIVSTEFLICIKFGWETITKPIPQSIMIWWIAGIAIIVLYTFIKFEIFKPPRLPRPEKEQVRISPVHLSSKQHPDGEADVAAAATSNYNEEEQDLYVTKNGSVLSSGGGSLPAGRGDEAKKTK